jgi:alkylation response protein AidB-like acyl-CoA dehydrogenase
MRFALTDDQAALRDAVRALLAKEPADSPATFDALIEMGVTSILVPEADGGLGMDALTAVLVLEQAGYAGVTFPVVGPVMGSHAGDDLLALGAAGQLLGLGQRMLDLTVGYVTEREQFGVPIGSFQAVKHHLADALKELAFARPVVYRAGWDPTAHNISMAKAMALQCHGAIGYTDEYELHRYLRQTWALTRTFGDAAWHRERIAHRLEIL